MAVQRNAGRRVISQAEAQAIAARAGVQTPAPAAAHRAGLNRREFLAYALAASGALLATGALVTLTMPDPSEDPLLGHLVPYQVAPQTGDKSYPVGGGYAYPRIAAGTFGGTFAIDQKASVFTVDDPPLLVPDGKFYVVKIAPDDPIQPVPDEDGQINAANIMAIYQVCVHLGCLVPYIPTEKLFICPCHGSTYQRDTQYVRGPAPRNLDQFRVHLSNDTVIVNTGQRVLGTPHS
jgi:cytochrome b6-f complex iron-sulfur subunit